jgi:uncharacterized protein YydD (DUF2326 family)
MKIKIGTLSSETEFDAVNVECSDIRTISTHVMIAGNVKSQEAEEKYQEFSIAFLQLTRTELDMLRSIYNQPGSLNLLLSTESYLINHNVKINSSLSYKLSKKYPGCYETKITCIEVG